MEELTDWKCPDCSQINPWDTSRRHITSCGHCLFVVLKDYIIERVHSQTFPKSGAHGEHVWIEFWCLRCERFNVRKVVTLDHVLGSIRFPCTDCGYKQDAYFEVLETDLTEDEELS